MQVQRYKFLLRNTPIFLCVFCVCCSLIPKQDIYDLQPGQKLLIINNNTREAYEFSITYQKLTAPSKNILFDNTEITQSNMFYDILFPRGDIKINKESEVYKNILYNNGTISNIWDDVPFIISNMYEMFVADFSNGRDALSKKKFMFVANISGLCFFVESNNNTDLVGGYYITNDNYNSLTELFRLGKLTTNVYKAHLYGVGITNININILFVDNILNRSQVLGYFSPLVSVSNKMLTIVLNKESLLQNRNGINAYTYEVLAHELQHAVAFVATLDNTELPTWANEGLSTFFAAYAIKKYLGSDSIFHGFYLENTKNLEANYLIKGMFNWRNLFEDYARMYRYTTYLIREKVINLFADAYQGSVSTFYNYIETYYSFLQNPVMLPACTIEGVSFKEIDKIHYEMIPYVLSVEGGSLNLSIYPGGGFSIASGKNTVRIKIPSEVSKYLKIKTFP